MSCLRSEPALLYLEGKLVLSVDYWSEYLYLPDDVLAKVKINLDELESELLEKIREDLVCEFGLDIPIVFVRLVDYDEKTAAKLVIPQGEVYIPYYRLRDVTRSRISLASRIVSLRMRQHVFELRLEDYAAVYIWRRLLEKSVPVVDVEIYRFIKSHRVRVTVECDVEARGLAETYLMKLHDVRRAVEQLVREKLGVQRELRLVDLRLLEERNAVELTLRIGENTIKVVFESKDLLELAQMHRDVIEDLSKCVSAYHDLISRFEKEILSVLSEIV